jgi:hypothetical protein
MIIAFTGLIGSGKTTAARYLAHKWGFTRIRFAQPMKDMLLALGLNEAHTDGDLKNRPMSALNNHTPRYAMQKLGTEWGRKCMGEDFWINAWLTSVHRHGITEGRIVVDDARFPNEYEAIKNLGGVVIRVERPGIVRGEHESEQHDLPYDHLLRNGLTIDHLYDAIDRFWEGHFWEGALAP